MYKRKKYRIGNSVVKKPDASTSSVSASLSSISTATNPPITSTPNEPRAGPSNILTELNSANLPPSQPVATQKQAVIISNDDDFVIPPSQAMQPSRYISQRSALIRSQLSYTQQTPMSYFESVLNRCGLVLTSRNSEISYTLNCDHLKFVIRLRKELTSHPKYPENIQTFLSGLIDTMKNQNQLVKILSGCIVSGPFLEHSFLIFPLGNFSIVSLFIQITLPNSELSKPSQESLMNDFLMIDFMQKDIISILMRKIKALAVEE